MIAEAALYPDDDLPNAAWTQEETVATIKQNLHKAQQRMKAFADNKRTERSFELGDMVYFKPQPYRHTSHGIHRYLKLHSKYYGPFRVIEKVGVVSYKLLLPDGCQLHPTFHVSQLKKHLGPQAVPNPKLPLLNPDGTIFIEREELLERKLIPQVQGNISIPVAQWCIKWKNLSHEQATWEDSSFIQKIFPQFQV